MGFILKVPLLISLYQYYIFFNRDVKHVTKAIVEKDDTAPITDRCLSVIRSHSFIRRRKEAPNAGSHLNTIKMEEAEASTVSKTYFLLYGRSCRTLFKVLIKGVCQIYYVGSISSREMVIAKLMKYVAFLYNLKMVATIILRKR